LELSECLTSDQFATLPEAIAAYERRMLKRASKAGQQSLENGKMMHSDDALNRMLKIFNK